MTENRLKHLVAGFAGIVAFIAYILTMAPTVSFWDCGEFVASANILGIPHPPGTPFFVLFSRFAIIVMPFVEEIAKRVNYISVISSALTVYLVALFTWDVLAKIVKEGVSDSIRRFAFATAALVSGFLLAFSDTFWFNAVEAEVYGFAMFLVVLVSWLALKWVDYRNVRFGDQIIVMIAYLAFLGIGVHLYSLLTIPVVFVLLLVGADPGKRLIRWPVWITGVILYSVVYKVDAFLSWSLLWLLVLVVGQFLASPNLRKELRLSAWLVFVALLGFSSHAYIPIRSSLNPTIDENNPEIQLTVDGKFEPMRLVDQKNWGTFNDYLARKQYGSESMLSRAFHRRGELDNQILSFPHMGYGGYQFAQYTPFKVGEVNYYRPGLYSVAPEDNPPVERMGMQFQTQTMLMGENTSIQLLIFLVMNGLLFYALFAAWKRNRLIAVYVGLLYAVSAFGLLFYINFSDGTKVEKPELGIWQDQLNQELNILAERGAKVPTIRNIDGNKLLSIQLKISMAKDDATRKAIAQNSQWQTWLQVQEAYKSLGYPAPELPNPVHLEVRDRDYFYTPAFIFMAMVYGLGAGLLLLGLATSRITLVRPIGAALITLAFAVPLFANYKEHSRAGNWIAWDYAYNLLMSCQPNSVLITNGDNDTFPLWFAQEVAGIRKDVRVVNLSLGNTDWYIKQIRSNEPIMKLSYTDDEIDQSVVHSNENRRSPAHQVDWWTAKAKVALETLQRQITQIDSVLKINPTDAALQARLKSRKEMYQVYDGLVNWSAERKGGFMRPQDKLVVDLALNNPDRPFHCANTVAPSNFVGLDKYMVQEGMVYTLVRGTLEPQHDAIDWKRTQYLVDSVYQYRGVGDGTTYVNAETERLLFNYNSLYIRLALETRSDIQQILIRKATDTAYAKIAATDIEEKAKIGLKYCEMGIKQFPTEWRNYAVAAELLDAAGRRAEAIAFLEKGSTIITGRALDEMNSRLQFMRGKEGK